jgi:hypothetical protein
MGRAESGGRRAFLVGVEGGAPREFCRDCGVLGFFPDVRRACVWTTPNDVVRLPIEGGEKRTLFRLGEDAAHAGWDIGDAAVSSDERFLLLLLGRGHGAPEVRIVPIDGAPKTERDGFVVATDARFLSCPRWSPGGDLVYYLAQRDGRIGVWAQRLERDTKRPRGEPFLVTHLGPLAHLVPRTWTGLDVAPGRLLVSASRWEANLWTGVVE